MVKLRLAKAMAVGLVMFLSASLVMAQEQGQGQRQGRQGGGGRGGFGGFGGGFGGPRGVLGLITNDAVKKELAVDEETAGKLKKVADDASAESRTEMEKVSGGREAFQGLSDDERRAKMQEIQTKSAEIRTKILAKYQPQLKEILSETQYQRLQQIYWQSSLTGALADPEVIKAIELTKEQQDKIAAVGKEYEEKQRGLFGRGPGGGGAGGAGGGFQEAMAKMQELNKERETKITDVLSGDQKEKFKTLKGKEFDVAQLRGGFGGPGGRGGRPGGAGGRPAGAGGRPAAEEKKAE